MINYPALFSDFGEALAQVGFSSPDLESLRQSMVDFLSEHETVTAEELIRHLSDGDEAEAGRKGLQETLAEATYLHAAFARPHRSADEAKEGWKSIWNNYLQELLRADLEVARRRYAEEPSDANLARLMAIREQVEAGGHDAPEEESAF